MAIREVLAWPDPRLRQVAAPVPAVTDAVRALVADLFETMYASGGVGLAATQVGAPWRVLVMDCARDKEERDPLAFINPVVEHVNGEIVWSEGCLSVPGVTAEVDRYAEVTVRYTDVDGQRWELETEGLLAVCIQHEIDHLDGKVFLDRLGSLERKATEQAYADAQREREAG